MAMTSIHEDADVADVAIAWILSVDQVALTYHLHGIWAGQEIWAQMIGLNLK